jgi:TolB-like protein
MQKKWILPVLAAAVFLFGLSACETMKEPEPTYEEAAFSRFIAANYAAADALLSRYSGASASTSNLSTSGGGTFLVSTLADINRLEQSSTLGRLISEQLSSRISQRGISVVEMKLRNNVFIKQNQGEFLLTREIRELATVHNAGAVLVGTYADGNTSAFVSLKLINPTNGVILSSHDYALPMDRQVRRLLTKN